MDIKSKNLVFLKKEPFDSYDVLISTNLRSRDFLLKAIKECDLLIIDEAHRVSPNGQAYKELLDQFDKESKKTSKLLGLTASPEEEQVIKKINLVWPSMQLLTVLILKN